MARTIPVGSVSEDVKRLIETTERSFRCGVEQFREGKRIGDIGHAVQSCVEAEGFSVVRRYVGHGVGHELHEDPEVPNYGTAGRGVRLCTGMTLAIEPMVNMGRPDVREMSDGWTVKTRDHSLSAHYENTVALTSEGVIITTLVDRDW